MAAPAKQSNIHAIIGTDEARVKETALALVQKLAKGNEEFGLETVNGNADNSDHATKIVGETLQALQTLPFFGGEKVVWLQSANFFGDTVTGRSQTTLDAVETLKNYLAAGLPGDVQFVLSASEFDKRRAFYKLLQKATKVEVFDKVDISKSNWEQTVMRDVEVRARKMGINFAGDALELFVLMVGADTRQLTSELEKLVLYLGEEKTATEDDVRAITSSTHTGVIFEVGNAIERRNLPRAIELIEAQLRKGESAIGILLAAIVPKVRNLLQARDLADRHRLNTSNYGAFQRSLEQLPDDETSHLPRAKTGSFNVYPLFFSVQACKNFTMQELKRAHEACLDANLALVTSGLDHHVVLSQLAARILGRH